MPYLIVHTINNAARIQLQRFRDGEAKKKIRKIGDQRQIYRTRTKGYPELFVLDLNEKTKVLRNNGMVLTFIAKLIQKYPNQIFVWFAERLTLKQFPKECVKVASWLTEKPGRNLNKAFKSLDISKEVLEKCKINYLLNLKK